MNNDFWPPAAPPPPPERMAIFPTAGESITSDATGNTYTIGAQIGEGSFGVVYECIDVWNNDLAAKVLKPSSTYEQVRYSAIAELDKLRTLRHPFVTYLFDAFEYRDTFYLITEKCNGSVSDLFRLNPFNGRAWLMPIARCLLQAVHYLHVNGYSHQDIHSGNVMSAVVRDELSPRERDAMLFKLGDFGVAKLFNELSVANTRAQWMLPPEVRNPAEFGPIDYRVDIYHCGLLLLQIAMSQEIHFTENEILGGRPRELALQLPAPLNFALEKALRRHVQSRTGHAMELWRDLSSPASL